MNKILFCLVGALMFLPASCTQESNEEVYLFVGTYADASDPGIHLYRFNTGDGTGYFVRNVSGIENPSYLALSKDESFIYAVSETDVPDASVYVYSFRKQFGDITFVDKKETEGASPCFIWVDGLRTFVVTANYMGGSMCAFPLSPSGKLGDVLICPYEGGTPGSARQEAPHPHCLFPSPDEKYLYLNDLGTDRIYKYHIVTEEERKAGFEIPLTIGYETHFSLPKGEGPRHAVFHPNGKFAYIIGELSGRVMALKYDDGHFDLIHFIEADEEHAGGSADIHVTPDGRFLYVSNRLKNDGLAIFSINQETGELKKVGYQPTEIHPRNFIITPNGKYLLCACRDGNVIQVFEINKRNGQLKNIQKDITVNKPVCLKFANIL